MKVGSDDVSQTQEVTVGSEDIRQIQEVQCSTSSDVSDAQHVVKVEAVTEVTDSTLSSHTLSDDVEVRASIRHSEISAEKHSLSLEVVIGLSIVRLNIKYIYYFCHSLSENFQYLYPCYKLHE